MLDLATELALELSRLQRKAHDRLRALALTEQRGEAWVDLPHADDAEVTVELDFSRDLFFGISDNDFLHRLCGSG